MRHGLSICGVVWCTWAVRLGSARTLLFCLQPLGKLAFKPHKGTTEMWRSKGWQEISLGRKACSHPWKLRICPIVKSPDTTVTIIRTQGKPFCASITQLGDIIGTRSPIVQSKWDRAGCVSVYVCLYLFFLLIWYFSDIFLCH